MPIKLGDLTLYDVNDLAEMLNIHDRTIRRLLREGTLPGRKLARKWYVSEESLKEYFRQQGKDTYKMSDSGEPVS